MFPSNSNDRTGTNVNRYSPLESHASKIPWLSVRTSCAYHHAYDPAGAPILSLHRS